jgi:hypothetical protein
VRRAVRDIPSSIHPMKLNSLALAMVAACLAACIQVMPKLSPHHEVDFVSEVKPLLELRCLECHNRHYSFAGLNLETKKSP